MVNPNKKIEIAVTVYITQIDGKPHKYYNADFFVTVVRLKRMYENEYARKGYHYAIQPFKARVLQ